LSTTAAGALAVKPALASFRSACSASARAAARSFSIRRRSAATSMTPATSSSAVTPSTSTDADAVKPSEGGLSRSSDRIRSSCPASGVASMPDSRAATRWLGRSP
jgi:hypothetical protein